MAADYEDLVRRLGATVRAAELYAPTHPLVQRTALGLLGAITPLLDASPTVIVGFLEDDVVVNDFRLPRGSANMAGLLRDMRDRKVEKITFGRGVEVADIRALMDELADRTARTAVGDRLTARGIRRVAVSKVAVEDIDDVVARLQKQGGELVDEIAQYEDAYRLCFMRGPEGIIVGLAEALKT